jgi:enoyl-CoA hydratase/carnithine racemase
MSELAGLEIDGARARLTLSRPESRNALSVELLGALHERLDELEAAEGVGVVVVSGAGPAFCAGMDLKQVLDDERAPRVLLRSLSDLCLRLRRLRSVVIASVGGAAIGGGCGLACVCDLAVTHADARLGFPEVDLGLCPAVVAPWVVRRIGAGPARRVLLSGGLMSGAEAGRLGLVSRVAPTREALDGEVEALAGRVGAGGPEALGATKALLNRLDGSLDEALARESADLSAEVLSRPESLRTLRERFGA